MIRLIDLPDVNNMRRSMTTGYPHPASMAFVRPQQPMNDYQLNLQQLGLNSQLLHNGALCRLGTQRRANMAISFAKNSAYIAETIHA